MIETRPRPVVHPLDTTSRALVALLSQRCENLEILDTVAASLNHDEALRDLLERIRRQDATWITYLESHLRRRLRPYSPDTLTEPW